MRTAIILGSIILLGACNVAADAGGGSSGTGGGKATQRVFDVGNFESVALGGSHNVIVSVGAAPSVRAEGDAEAIDRLDIRVEGGELKIGTKRGSAWSWNSNRAPVTIHVTTPSLAAASIGGSGDMRIDKVEGGEFKASIGGSGDMEIASLRTGQATFSIAGSGTIKAAGAAQKSTISIAGSGDMDLERLESRTANVSVLGSGDVRARAMESAEISMKGSGDVTMSGTAKCTVNKLGSGDVRCET